MKLIIDIDKEDYEIMKYNIAIDNPLCPLGQKEIVFKIANGTPLDKIRDEIAQTTSRYSISRERDCAGQVEWSDRLIKESEVLEILDKYKGESEDNNAEDSN